MNFVWKKPTSFRQNARKCNPWWWSSKQSFWCVWHLKKQKNVNLHNYPLDANEQKGCKKIRNTSILINWCHFQWVSRALNWTVVFAYILQGLKNIISSWRNMEVMEVWDNKSTNKNTLWLNLKKTFLHSAAS